MIPTSGRPASSSRSSVSGIVVISVSWSRWEAWIGSSPSRTPASSAAAASRRRPSTTRLRAACLVAAAGRAGEAEHAVGLVEGEPVQRRSHRRDPLLDVVRAVDHRVGQDRRHLRDAVRDAEAGRAQRLEGGFVVAELHLPDPDPVEARCFVRADVLLERRSDGRDLAEGERHGSPGTFASTRRTSGGLRQLLRDQVAGAGAEAGAGVGARADVPELLDRRLVARRRGRRAEEQVLVERARPRVDVAADPGSDSRASMSAGRHDDPCDGGAAQVRDVTRRSARRSGRRTPRGAPPSRCRRRRRARRRRRPSASAAAPAAGPRSPRSRPARATDRRSSAARATIVASAGKQAAVGLVDGARDAVEAGREVDERRAGEALVTAPARKLVHARCGSASRRGRSGSGAPGRGSVAGASASPSRRP